eukprot:3603760-Rhodomonas_salina.6
MRKTQSLGGLLVAAILLGGLSADHEGRVRPALGGASRSFPQQNVRFPLLEILTGRGLRSDCEAILQPSSPQCRC